MSVFSLLAEILFVGHSLVGPTLPQMVQTGLEARGEPVTVSAQIINGAPLRYNWEHAATAEGVNGRETLAKTPVEALILTEALPLDASIEWNQSAQMVADWASTAWATNPGTQVYIYETWHSLKSGTGATVEHDPGASQPWTDRLANDLPKWESLADTANRIRPASAPPLQLIPAGQAMGLAAGAAAKGTLPGISRIDELFSDDIHPNGRGLYLVAMVQIAALTGQSPEGLPALLGRSWDSRADIVSPELAEAMQRIAWQAVSAQRRREAGRAAMMPETATEPTPVQLAATETVAEPEPEIVPEPAQVTAPEPVSFTPVTNPNLALGLAGVVDWSAQQPFMDVMKTARPWAGHLEGQWGGFEYNRLAAEGWLDDDGWPRALPPGVSGLATLVLTDLPADAGGVAGRYRVEWRGKGQLRLDGRAQNIRDEPGAAEGAGALGFDFTPGEGAVILTITATDPQTPIRDITIIREDHRAAVAAGQIFNPLWLDRIRGVKLLRFMDWMATNDSTLASLDDSPRLSDFTWARNGVPVEVMLLLANELDADPWFTMPHLADDALVRFYAEAAQDLLEPGLRAWVEFSNEVWNWQFAQARWAEDQGKARWQRDGTWMQYYGLRAAEVAGIWADTFGDEAPDRLVRVIATQTGITGAEDQILNAPLAVAEGLPPPKSAFDAYAVTGYFAALLGSQDKQPMLKSWLTESAAADPQAPYALATARAVEELREGRHSGLPEDTLGDVLTRVLPYQAEVARKNDLRLVMYEGGSHVVGYGPVVDDAETTAFLQHLNYTPEMGALYTELLTGWARLTDAPFNAFVDIYAPGKWGSWGALRHLGDENPRWQALARGCGTC